MAKFRKRPVEIEAVQYDGFNSDEIEMFSQGTARFENGELTIRTLEGAMRALPRDWVICGVQGEFYPCKPDIFEKTYEAL